MSPPEHQMVWVSFCDRNDPTAETVSVEIPYIQFQVILFIECYTAHSTKNIHFDKVPDDFRAYRNEQYHLCYAHFRRCLTWLEEVQGDMFGSYIIPEDNFFPNGLPNLVLPL